jgi:hypothetical protein
MLKKQRPNDVTEAEGEILLELWDKDICPFCEKIIPEGQRLGSGRKREGGFCSLDCYTQYHKVKLAERMRIIVAVAVRHRDS